jgi:hypothetical protein
MVQNPNFMQPRYIPANTLSAYIAGKQSFISEMLPAHIVQTPTAQILYVLEKKLGAAFFAAMRPENTIESPVKTTNHSTWIKTANMVGINVRTVGNFWNVVKYALTLPKTQNSIHLLPIWEPGVVASLYGIASWNINPEFFSEELYRESPVLDTVEKQLKVVVNLLHALGKTVGMDVIPHTDRFSEPVLANPQFFEWIERMDDRIINHSDKLYLKVQDKIYRFLKTESPQNLPNSKELFFSKNFPEETRLEILFGKPNDYGGRLERREALIQMLYDAHLETAPATMGPPYRGLRVNTDASALTVDEKGRIWRDYEITKPQSFSRAFGPLTRYKLYEAKDDNYNWEIDFEKPLRPVWEYVARHYLEVQQKYNFDFMRGDMAHVQMRPNGVPAKSDEYYDLMQYIKASIQKRNPIFGSFAETFLAPTGEMAYGDEDDHLEMTDADSTLGNLQSMPIGTTEFLSEFRRYLDLLHTRRFAPNFTIMTADKDDPRFDTFYVKGNEARFFIGLFLTDMPSYMSLGFEQRDVHLSPAPNEHYTKLYVFKEDRGAKATHDKYVWGNNVTLFDSLNEMKKYSDVIFRYISDKKVRWLLLPDPTGYKKVIAWTHMDDTTAQFLFVVNLDVLQDANAIKIPASNQQTLHFNIEYSTEKEVLNVDKSLIFNGIQYPIGQLKAGECRIYKAGTRHRLPNAK